MSDNSVKLQVVIPCFNEANNLGLLVKSCADVVKMTDGEINFLLVDNGSNDDSKSILNSELQNTYGISYLILEHNLGYGGGILAGLKMTKAKYIGWSHADLQTPLEDCIAAFATLNEHIKFVKGRRKNRKLGDKFFSLGMSLFESALFGMSLKEINAQPTLMDRKLYERWQDPPSDFSLDLYALVMAISSNTTIGRVNVRFLERYSGTSSWNYNLKSKFRFIKRTLSYSFRLKRQLK